MQRLLSDPLSNVRYQGERNEHQMDKHGLGEFVHMKMFIYCLLSMWDYLTGDM